MQNLNMAQKKKKKLFGGVITVENPINVFASWFLKLVWRIECTVFLIVAEAESA